MVKGSTMRELIHTAEFGGEAAGLKGRGFGNGCGCSVMGAVLELCIHETLSNNIVIRSSSVNNFF